MKKMNTLKLILLLSCYAITSHGISGTFYNSIANRTSNSFWSGLEYQIGTDRWDNCGWWGEYNWGYYRTGTDCSGSTGKGISSYSVIGQTGGHESRFGRTAANQKLYIDYPSGTRGLQITNDVNGSDSEHIYIKTWCKNKQEWQDKEYVGQNMTTFQKTIILPSANGGYDVAYALFEYNPQYGATPDEYVDFFESNKGTADLISARYVTQCF